LLLSSTAPPELIKKKKQRKKKKKKKRFKSGQKLKENLKSIFANCQWRVVGNRHLLGSPWAPAIRAGIYFILFLCAI
jgi:hypothetical protein